MWRFPLPGAVDRASVTGALALAVAVLALVAAGCSSGGRHHAATTTANTPSRPAACKLNRAQRRTVARAMADIRRLRRIQAPVRTFSQHGAPNQEEMTGKFLLDAGSTNLPLNVFSHLIHLAKVAVNLCGDCDGALETSEPFLGNRGQNRCG